MCGDIDEESGIDEKIFANFLAIARAHGVRPTETPTVAFDSLASAEARTAYMDRLFRSGLARCVNDAAALPEGERVDAIAAQAIVFARLAGLIAGQLPPQSELFRMGIEAFMDGHAAACGTGGAAGHDSDHHH